MKLLVSSSSNTDVSCLAIEDKGMRLPKLDTPTFDGNLVKCPEIVLGTIHHLNPQLSALSDAKKLVHLCHSIKDGSATEVIEGLWGLDEFNAEAIESLKASMVYYQPRMIHQAHVLSLRSS